MHDLEKNLDNNTIFNNSTIYLPATNTWSEAKRFSVPNILYLGKIINNCDDAQLLQLLEWIVYDKSIIKNISNYDIPYIWYQIIYNNFLKPPTVGYTCTKCNMDNTITLSDSFIKLYDKSNILVVYDWNDAKIYVGPQKKTFSNHAPEKYSYEWFKSFIYKIEIDNDVVLTKDYTDEELNLIFDTLSIYNFEFEQPHPVTYVGVECIKCKTSVNFDITEDLAKSLCVDTIVAHAKTIFDTFITLKDTIDINYINTIPFIDFQIIIKKIIEKHEKEKQKGQQ